LQVKRREDDLMRMGEIDIHDYARQMLEAYGDKAVVTAAQRACRYEEKNRRSRECAGPTSAEGNSDAEPARRG